MTHRPRKAKQKPIQSHEIVGILPSEEADIQRALMASITKTTAEEGTSHQPPQRRAGRPARLTTTPKYPTTKSAPTTKSVSSSPTSSSSIISFLSTDSHSSLTWSPPNRRSPRLKQKKLSTLKKLPRKTSSPQKVSPRNKSIMVSKMQKSPPPKTKTTPTKTKTTPTKTKTTPTRTNPTKNTTPDAGMKSTHTGKKSLLGKKTKLIACAVRKKANVEEPRNEDGLTVDEILKSVATQTKLLDQPLISSKTSKFKKPTPLKSLQPNKSPPPRNSPLTLITPEETKAQSSATINTVTISTVSNTAALEKGQSTAVKYASDKNTSPDRHSSPNSFLYQAQRKFASNQCLPTRRVSRELTSPLHLKETPMTEDFLRFLCLRGSERVPDSYRKFGLPWTPTTAAPDPNRQTICVSELNKTH